MKTSLVAITVILLFCSLSCCRAIRVRIESDDDEWMHKEHGFAYSEDGSYVVVPAEMFHMILGRAAEHHTHYEDCDITIRVDGYETEAIFDSESDDQQHSGYEIVYAWFGYTSTCDHDHPIPIGQNNHFHPKPRARGQIEHFYPGTHTKTFKVPLTGADTNGVTWEIRAPNFQIKTAIAGGVFR